MTTQPDEQRAAMTDEEIRTLADQFMVGKIGGPNWGFAWLDFARAIEARLSALPAGGWKLVPIYPTKEMIEAGAEHTLLVADVDPDDERAMKDARNTSRGCVMAAYMDMVEAAPAAPRQQENPK